jgi:DNA-binding transcriptional LysR family regulator
MTTGPVLLNRLLARARFRHLQLMLRVAELGSLRAAAQSMDMSQPAATQLLADLESLLGLELFHRHARGARPTAAGQALLPMARQALGGLQAAAEAVAERNALGAGVVRVVATPAAVNGVLVAALPAFNLQHPEIQVHVREAELDEQRLAIGRGEVDLALCRETPNRPAGWRFEPLLHDEFVVACAPSHPLVRRSRIRLKELSRWRWLVSPIDSAARQCFDELIGQQPGLSAPVQVITRVSSMTAAMLLGQPLLTLVPASVFAPWFESGALRSLKLERRLPFNPVGLMIATEAAPLAARRLADFLLRRLRDRGAAAGLTLSRLS